MLQTRWARGPICLDIPVFLKVNMFFLQSCLVYLQIRLCIAKNIAIILLKVTILFPFRSVHQTCSSYSVDHVSLECLVGM